MNSTVSGQQTERILLARLVDLANGSVAPSGSASGGGISTSGNVGGFTSLFKQTLTTTSTTYSAGKSIGGLITITNAVRAAGTGLLESISVFDKSHNGLALDLILMDATPGTPPADNNVWSIAAGDIAKIIGRIPISAGDWVTYNNIGLASIRGLGLAVKAASGTSLFAALLCNASAPVLNSTSDVGLSVGILQD